MTPFSQYTQAGFQAGVQRLFPGGRAWPRRLTSTLAALAGAIGDTFYQLHVQMVLLLDVESDPAQAVQLLPDWETDYGLPDPCTPANPPLTLRHAALMAKIAGIGGQSAAYYISVAAALGYTITITTWTPPVYGVATYGGASYLSPAWRFAWQVNAPTITVDFAKYGESVYGDAFWSIDDTTLECRLRAIAPGYGVLWFKYG
ncbi:MAG: DUF2313 domain-containing protein [Proteobacteria bacterium]|nr:DUF2313 domain-containing protein [Pseudomonadota bacterium]